MLKHSDCVLHCNESPDWTGFVFWWHPGRRFLFYSMKLAVKSVVVGVLCCKSEKGFVANVWEVDECSTQFVISTIQRLLKQLPGVIKLNMRPA